MSESAGHFAEAGMIVDHRLEDSLDAGRDEIREVKAPQWTAPESDGASMHEVDPAPVYEVPEEARNAQVVPAQEQQPAADTAPAAADPFSTTAMPPIDVSELRLGDMPPINDVPMPSFLDPRKVQEEARAALAEERRSGNRVDVTGVSIGASGRIDLVPDYAEDDMAPTAPSAGQGVPQPIVLPDIGAAASNLTPISELSKQRAPLADVETSGKTAAKSLLSMLPSINLGGEAADSSNAVSEANEPSSPGKTSLRSILPSLSGSISREDLAEGKTSNVSAAGAFVPAGATGTFAPIGDELLDNVDPEDIYVDDADDSAYDQNFTETGAFAGPGYVEMPKSRVHRLFDRLRRKNKNEEATPQEWLEVDEAFDARTVGAARGGWESFREEDSLVDPSSTTRIDPYNVEYAEDEYGTFEDDGFEDDADGFDYGEVDEFDNYGPDNRRPWNGGAFSPRRMEKAAMSPESLMGEMTEDGEFDDPDVPAELKQIYQFRNPDINTEVWFVALGSELAQNGGMRAFLNEHQQDLRGSIIIDLDALGAGDLCMVEQEGMYRAAKTSSRMKRYVKKASQATGLSVGAAQIKWKESAASYAIKHGYQAMHLVGMQGAKPAFYAQGDDVLENIDEQTLESNAEFVMELLKNI